MIRLLNILVLSLVAILPCAAQTAVGSWTQVSSFGGKPSAAVATADRLYYVSNGYLGSVESDGGDIRTYSTSDILNSSKVTNVYYNHERHFAAVVYEGGNIDLLYDNGNCYNLSDIKDAQMMTDKKVNDISFSGSRMYVATNFGMVEFDVEKLCVVWTMILDANVESIFVMGDKLMLSYNLELYCSPINVRHNSLAMFTNIGGAACHYVIPVSDHAAIGLNGNMTGPWQLIYMTFPDDYSSYSLKYLNSNSSILSLTPLKGGGAVAMEANRIVYVDVDGNCKSVPFSTAMDGCSSGSMVDGLVASYKGSTDIWTATTNGISHYSLGSDGTSTPTLLTGPVKPISTSCTAIGYINKGPVSGNIYLGSMGTSAVYGFYDDVQSHLDVSTGISSYKEITPSPTSWVEHYPARDGLCYGNLAIAENPKDQNLIFIGNYWEGIYRMDLSGKLPLVSYNWTNSKFSYTGQWSCLVPAIAFDPEGNLWAAQYVRGTDAPAVYVLPSDKTRSATLNADDWRTLDIENFSVDKDGRILISSRHKSVILATMNLNTLAVVDTKGTWATLTDDRYTVRDVFTDQDGLTFTATYPHAIVEDNNGRIWVGHESGVFEISDIEKFHNSDFTVTRLKVPRNDGTNSADYLLDGQRVTSIAVDGSNRKWVGTDVSGLYLVSSDGSSVIEHFTTDNSALPTNCVYSVYCDDESNLVYVGTSVGLMIYSSDSAPAASDYSDVYAYPNPVRPDYTGWITVTGLMDNSLVKIADSAGNVFFNGRSNGGMITWDGCDASGNRVHTGVYYVFASEAANGGGTGVVTKILVVN